MELESPGFLRSVLETAPVDTIVVDADETVAFASETIADVLGYSPDDLVGRSFADLVVDDDRSDSVPLDGEHDRLNVVVRHAAGGEVRIRADTRPVEFDGQQLSAVFVRASSDREAEAVTIDRYEAITRMPGYGIYQLGRDGCFEMVNDTIVEQLGYSRDDLLGEHASVIVGENDRATFLNAFESPLDAEGERAATVEFDARTVDDETIPCEARVSVLRSDGSIRGTVGIVRDISDRRERAEELRQERGLIEHVLETSPVGIGVITPDGDISRVNDRAEELLGLTMEELSSQTFDVSQRKLYDSEGRQVSPEDLLSRVFDDREQVIDTEFTLERPEGDQVWASISIAPMTDAAGDVEKAAIIATDITDRKEREEALRQERDVIEHVLETSPVGIGVITPDGDISRVNGRAEELFGLTDYELTTQTLDVSQRQLYDSTGRGIPPEDLLSRVFDDRERVLDSEFRLENPGGSRVWLSISIAPIEGRVGDVEKAVIIGKDVTDRKEREETLRQERDVIEHILETSPVGIGVITPDGDISRVNEQAEELLGLTIGEITSQTLDVTQRRFYGASGQQVQPEDLLSRVFEDRERVLNSEFRLERPDGERVWTALSIAPIQNREGDVEKAVVIATDISDRKQREKRLRESEARLRQIAENINSAIWMADADLSEVLYINPAYEDITGRSRDSVYDTLLNHLEAVHPQDRRRVESAVNEVTQAPPDGGTAIRFQEKYRLVQPDGSVRWVDSFAFPLQDDDGEVYRFVGVIDDITEVKEQQLELGRQRDELETLNGINTVIRRVNQELVQAATREEIERQVCDTLTDSKLYHAAWIGEVDTGIRDVTPMTGDGLRTESVDRSFEIDAVDAISMAVESGDIQLVRNFDDLPSELAVSDSIDDGLFGSDQSSAAVIPLLYKETVYDVLLAYSSRANAFSVREQAVLYELGKTIGLAINAVERKEALLTDSIVELEFGIHDPGVFFVHASDELEVEFEMEGITSQSDGSYLQYFTVSGDSPDRVLELADEDRGIEHARVITEHEGGTVVEFVVAGSSLATALAEYGGTVHTATFAEGRGTVVAAFSQTADHRNVVEAVQSTFARTDLVSKQQRERSIHTKREFQTTLEERLTERQRTTLETAYYAGYFEWPRDSSGEDVADSLDVAPATFHQHTRDGIRKLVETFIEGVSVS
ncbi:PAS domain S-box protein [Natronorubrum sp. FCH18a]|uniref:PAS domain S-box protein n=1 Tax=Natronorubrum sp. FCH18a TaxID=3447018 RepID=UPI003F517FDB